MLIINIVSTFGVANILAPFISFIPMSSLIISLVIWIGLMKVFFREMSMLHAVIAGVVGFLLSMFIIPILIGMVISYLPNSI